jgi:hypothetical protein
MTMTTEQLAEDFDAAWKGENGCSDEELDASIARTRAFVEPIINLSGADVLTMRLKMRLFIWAQAVRPDEWCADVDGGYTADGAIASLCRDLGADYPVGGVQSGAVAG